MFSNHHIRSKARETIHQTPGSLFLAALPVSGIVLVQLFQVALHRPNLILQYATDQAALHHYLLSTLSFSFFFQLLLSLMSLSMLLSLFQVIKKGMKPIKVKDSLSIFQSPAFNAMLRTFFLKSFYLVLWSFLGILGIILFVGSFFIATSYVLTHGVVSADALPDDLAIAISGLFLLGISLFIAGCSLFFPNYYAYSQVECILFEQIETKQPIVARAIIKESRYMMRGYKGKRFLLDISFIGWFILYLLTFSLVGIYFIPYYQAAHIHFYESLKPIVEAEKEAYRTFLQSQTDPEIQ